MYSVRDLVDRAFGSIVATQRPDVGADDADVSLFAFNPYEDELRARNGLSFRAGISATGGNVSPSNVVLFNPATSKVNVIVNKLWYVIPNTGAIQLFALAADPALTAAAAGLNELLGGPAPAAITENADAATPANTGVLWRAVADNAHTIEILQRDQIIMPPGTGINFQFATSAALYQVSFVWDELAL